MPLFLSKHSRMDAFHQLVRLDDFSRHWRTDTFLVACCQHVFRGNAPFNHALLGCMQIPWLPMQNTRPLNISYEEKICIIGFFFLTEMFNGCHDHRSSFRKENPHRCIPIADDLDLFIGDTELRNYLSSLTTDSRPMF